MAFTSNQKLFNKYIQKMETLNKDKNVDDIYDALLNGKNSYLRMSHVESSRFDPTWIKVIEDVLYDLGEIISNPRSVTKVESNVVPVELAKKINGESVQHLASHTQYIKEIDENGDVVPSKILSHSNEDNIHTYENRFIATFIRRLVLFIEKRYQFVTENVSLFTDNVLLMKNETMVNGQLVEIETKVRVRKENEDEVAVQAREYIERIKSMREYVTYYYNSPFMRQMKTERDVRKPIIQTNIIRKNPKYRHCFETFMFIEKFDSLGVTYKVDENYSLFSPEELREYNYLLLSQYLSLQDERPFKEVKKNEKVYKPKIQTSIDDEKFVYGPLYKGPIEFVRVDEGYRKYRESLVRNDLPEHPTKQEKEFYKDEYNFRKFIKEEQKQIDRLLSRTYKDIKEFEKAVEKILALRQKEEFEAEQERLRAIREEEDRRIEAKRREIIAAAKAKAHEEKLRLQEEERLRKEEEERFRREAEEQARKEEEARLEAERLAKEEEERYLAALAEEQKNKEEPVIEEIPEEESPVEEQEIILTREDESTSEPEPVIVAPVIEEQEEEQPQEEVIEEPIVEEPIEETPVIEEVVEEPVEEVPAEEPVIEEAPVVIEAPIEEAVEEQPQEEPVIEEEPAQEEPVVEEPVKEEPVKKPRAPRKKKAKKAPKEEAKVEEVPAPAEEPVVEEKQPEPEPVIEAAPIIVEAPKEEKKPQKAKKKATKKKVAKPAPVVEPEKNERKPREKKEDILEKIPGKFIVKAYEGYYINDKKFSVYKKDAKIFDDFNVAKQIKARFGGKVIKL